jgi:flagellum-specific peptidoglycan hydrolase FlgJ
MKLYKFDEQTLTFKQVKKFSLVLLFAFAFFVSMGFTTLINIHFSEKINKELMAIIINDSQEKDKFTFNSFKNYLKELNIKYPHIVMAQAILETNNFQSHIFKENHNLFGMKVATRRPTTNKGEDNGHAYYNNWRESVQDYAFYSAVYLNGLNSEEDYFTFLSQYYAEDPNYIDKLKNIIQKNNLKQN